jgi:putative membrane protein
MKSASSGPGSGSADFSTTAALPRCVVGGVLMGLANLVPGISGGTMLLAAGVYPVFVDGVANLSRFRFRRNSLIPLSLIVAAAGLAIVLFAGTIKGLVVDHRWAMYSAFIGLTFGGVPVIWRLLKPANFAAWAGCGAGIAVMAALAMLQPHSAADASQGVSFAVLLLAGLAGASAMILPGISGGYLLLVLGQYVVILSAIEQARAALLGEGGPDVAALLDAASVVIPVGAGVLIGVATVSNLIRALLARYQKATLGVLLGLLVGAVLGLWPFQQGVAPSVGDIVKGRVMTQQSIAELDADDYPLERFSPSAGQIAGALGLIAAGFLVTQGVARIGRSAGGES